MSPKDKVALWNAINSYAQARGADMTRTDVGIQLCVVDVERAVELIISKARPRKLEEDPTDDGGPEPIL